MNCRPTILHRFQFSTCQSYQFPSSAPNFFCNNKEMQTGTLIYALFLFMAYLANSERLVVVGPVSGRLYDFLDVLRETNIIDQEQWLRAGTKVVFQAPFFGSSSDENLFLLQSAYTLSLMANDKGGEINVIMGFAEKALVDGILAGNSFALDQSIQNWIFRSFVPFYTRDNADVIVSFGVLSTENMDIQSLQMTSEWYVTPYQPEHCEYVKAQLKTMRKKILIIGPTNYGFVDGECNLQIDQLSPLSDSSRVGVYDYELRESGVFIPIPMGDINAELVTYAFGDFHGDLSSFLTNLGEANLIRSDHTTQEVIIKDIDEGKYPPLVWIGGRVNLVFTGDILDRGPNDIHIWEIIRFLYPIVRENGGHLEALLGNHELMNFMGLFNDVNPALVATDELKLIRRKKLSLDDPLGRFMRGLRAVVQIGQTVFVHGGIETPYAEFGIEAINDALRHQLSLPSTHYHAHDIFANDGPFWSRRFSLPPNTLTPLEMCAELQKSLSYLGAAANAVKPVRMVVAHTIQENRQIGSDCDGALVKIDIGLSRYVWSEGDGSVGALKIVGNEAFALDYFFDATLIPLRIN
eukprot:Partr_v1_DN28687_c1_g1_i3_m49732 putative NA